ncbi:MAG: sensor histidine kinase [Buchananella hordeovulneris]|nr:sensor histidine kinase [Buchananella hordeovulneris]
MEGRDGAIAVGALAATALILTGYHWHWLYPLFPLGPAIPVAALIASLGAAASTVLARHLPAIPLAAVLLVTASCVGGGNWFSPVAIVLPYLLYEATSASAFWVPLTGYVSTSALTVLAVFNLSQMGNTLTAGLFFALYTAITATAALLAGVWRRNQRTTDARAKQESLLAQEAAHQALLAASATERTRIAREMHDIVAHSLSVVIAQADGGRYAAKSDPSAAERALTTIAEISRAALKDMRAILGVLRGPEEDALQRLPQPMDDDLDALVATMSDSGLPTSIVRVGTPQVLAPGMGLTVHRLVQEALTNVLKYGGPAAHATVMVTWGPTSLEITVDDDGRGASVETDGKGHGIIGMRERVAAFGGTLQAGARPGGGFRVRAHLPLLHGPAAIQAANS